MDSLDFLRSGVSLIGRRKLLIIVITAGAILLSGPLFIHRLSVDERAFLFRGQMILLIEAVLFSGSWYVWVRLRSIVDSISRRDRGDTVVHCTWFAKLAVALMLFLSHMSFVIHYFISGDDPLLLSLICFTCLGIHVQFVVCYFCLGRAYQVINWTKSLFFVGERAPYNISAVHRMKFITASLFSVSISIYGLYGGMQAPTVKTVEIPVKGLAASMDRLNVAVIADIHLGPTVGRTKLERVVHMVNSLKPG